MNQEENLKALLKQYKVYMSGQNKDTIYYDSTFHKLEGINYGNFHKLYYQTINDGEIKSKYTVQGWYILWYLLTISVHGKYCTVTLEEIKNKTNLSIPKLKIILEHLKKNKIIYYSEKTLTNSKPIDMVIDYSSEKQGYNAIPTDLIKIILPSIGHQQWAIYTALISNYNYYQNIGANGWKALNYAFPSQETLAEKLGMARQTIGIHINGLAENQYGLIKIVSQKKRNMESYTYQIPLMERVEYVYQNIIYATSPTDQLHKNIMKDYGDIIRQHKEALKNHNIEWYDNNKQKLTIRSHKKNTTQTNQQ